MFWVVTSVATFLTVLCANINLAWASADLESHLSKQIAWTAANIQNPEVVRIYQKNYPDFVAQRSQLEKTAEGRKIFQQGSQLFQVTKLKKNFEDCELENDDTLSLRKSLSSALDQQCFVPSTCEVESKPNAAVTFGTDLKEHLQKDARDRILLAAQSQLQQTNNYWNQLEKSDHSALALDLTEKALDLKTSPPKEGAELLLYTKALNQRVNKDYITKADVKNAFKEVKDELAKNATYLKSVQDADAEKALRQLVVTNPAAVAQFLIHNPESFDLICQALQKIDQQKNRNAIIEKTFLWGGLVIAGVLIGSGIGAVVGVPMSAALTTIAAGAAIAGTATGVGDTIYSSSKTYQAYSEAQDIRSSTYAEGLSDQSLNRVTAADEKARSELVSSSFAVASIIPFGAGYKIMKSTAQASHADYGKVIKATESAELQSSKNLSRLFNEVSNDKALLQILEKTSSKVPDEEIGQFLGHMSSLPQKEKEKIFALIKAKPEKVAEAIRGSAKNGVCK